MLVELEVGAARHTERIRLLDESARIDQAQVRADDVLHGDEPALVRELHKAWQRLRHLQVSKVHRSTRRVAHHDGERESQVGDEGEGVAGRPRHGLWRDEREDFLPEVAAQQLLLGRRQVRPAQHAHAARSERRQAYVRETASLPVEQGPHADPDGVDLLVHSEPAHTHRQRPTPAGRRRALERVDTHHEKLVQISAQDGQEADPGEQRDARVLRQLQHPSVELEQAQIAVQEVLRARTVDVGNGGAQCQIGQSHPTLAGLARRRRPRGLARPPPLREDVRPGRHRERRESPRVAQHGRAGRGEQVAERQPLEPSGDTRAAAARDPPRQPDLEHRSHARQSSRCRAEEPHLSVGAAEKRAQDLTAGLLALAAPHRQRE